MFLLLHSYTLVCSILKRCVLKPKIMIVSSIPLTFTFQFWNQNLVDAVHKRGLRFVVAGVDTIPQLKQCVEWYEKKNTEKFCSVMAVQQFKIKSIQRVIPKILTLKSSNGVFPTKSQNFRDHPSRGPRPDSSFTL